MKANNWNDLKNHLLSKNSERNPDIKKALDEWNYFAAGEFDTRSGPKAAKLFQHVAKESDEGCVVLALVFYDLFQEFGGFPRKSLFDERLNGRVESVSTKLIDEEKEVVEWFLMELGRRV